MNEIGPAQVSAASKGRASAIRDSGRAKPARYETRDQMSQENIAGFLMGISVGVAIGFFLKTPVNGESSAHTVTDTAGEKPDNDRLSKWTMWISEPHGDAARSQH
jgi:hypothetical protein